jgi:adenylosuccinate synthase
MPVTVIVGGQFGSEGKGKVAFSLARDEHAQVAVRVGGPNSGHTVIDSKGSPRIFRHLPTAALLDGVLSVLPPGSYLDPDTFLREVKELELDHERVAVDPNASVIAESDQAVERSQGLRRSIGSTETGTGSALMRRIRRLSTECLAQNEPRLAPFIRETAPLLRKHLRAGHRILIEGTQGFGLSLLHSPHFPFATSRDTTAAGFVSEAGLSPLDVDDIVMVIRAFPIRVAGHSGPLPGETTWEDVAFGAGSVDPLVELTSVTKAVRRVARFDPEIVKRAITNLDPSRVVLNHVDHVDSSCRDRSQLSERIRSFVAKVEDSIDRTVDCVGTGPATLVWLRTPRHPKESVG